MNAFQCTFSYRRLALQYHPDKNDTEEALELFQQVSEAYCILIDGKLFITKIPPYIILDDKRAEYDREQTSMPLQDEPTWTSNPWVQTTVFPGFHAVYIFPLPTDHFPAFHPSTSRTFSRAFEDFETVINVFFEPRQRRRRTDPFATLQSWFAPPFRHRRHHFF